MYPELLLGSGSRSEMMNFSFLKGLSSEIYRRQKTASTCKYPNKDKPLISSGMTTAKR
jgi:hypothetical protein